MQIRPIVAADTASYHRCLDLVCRERRYLALLQAPPLEQTRAFVLRQIEQRHPMSVAVAGGEVLGWCDITPLSRPTFQHRGQLGMGIHPAHRHQGLGRRLLRATVAEARLHGLEQVELLVRADNAYAIALYQQEGFARTGTTPRAIKLNGVYFDGYLMTLIL